MPPSPQLPLGVAYATRDGNFLWCNEAFDSHARSCARRAQEQVHPRADPCRGRQGQRGAAERPVGRAPQVLFAGKALCATRWQRTVGARHRGNDPHAPMAQPVCTVGFLEDISARKKMELQMEQVQKALVDASRQAGMAEVATNVLHNVGNVLNSINVSASLAADRIKPQQGCPPRRSRWPCWTDTRRIWPASSAATSAARSCPQYLAALAVTACRRARSAAEGTHRPARQPRSHQGSRQPCSRPTPARCGVLETVPVVDLVEDSLRMNTGALTRHHVALRARVPLQARHHGRQAQGAADPGEPDPQCQVRLR